MNFDTHTESLIATTRPAWIAPRHVFHAIVGALEARSQFTASRKEPEAGCSLGYICEGGVARITVRGLLVKHASNWDAAHFGVLVSDTDFPVVRYSDVAAMIETAARDKDAKALLLVIDSPGGTFEDLTPLCFKLREVGEKKPVVVFTEQHLMGSALVLAASAAQKILAPKEARNIGGIEILGSRFALISDLSEREKERGKLLADVRRQMTKKVVRKASTTPGEAVCDAQTALASGIIDGLGQVTDAFHFARHLAAQGGVRIPMLTALQFPV